MKKKNCNIMVVDDEPKALELVKAMLAPRGYETILVNDSKKAIGTAIDLKPDLILLDIMMPELDGYSILNELKDIEKTKNIPVIMLTAVGHELNKKLADSLGAAGYITKPIDSSVLSKTVARFIRPVIHKKGVG